MPRCLNCSYKLVFLENRLRYKCAKCGKGFLPKFIENRNFRVWNSRMREIVMQELTLEINQRKRKKKQLIKLNKISRAFRLLFASPRKISSVSSEERKIRKREARRRWNENNPEKVRIMKKRYVDSHRTKTYAYLKSWRASNLDKFRLNQRLAHWRRKQGEMALETLKSILYKN